MHCMLGSCEHAPATLAAAHRTPARRGWHARHSRCEACAFTRALPPHLARPCATRVAGAVVLNKDFYKDTSGNILSEICECVCESVCVSCGPGPDAHLLAGASQAEGMRARPSPPTPLPPPPHHAPRQTGKEYSKADSRYATRDDFVISMEAVTAFVEGPACFAIVWGMLQQKPWRFVAIMLTSLGQLYGDVLYFGTCMHGGARCVRAAGVVLPPAGALVQPGRQCGAPRGARRSTRPTAPAGACAHARAAAAACARRHGPALPPGVHLLLVLLPDRQRHLDSGAAAVHPVRGQGDQPGRRQVRLRGSARAHTHSAVQHRGVS
jgi:hypothetical protein